MKAGLLLLLVAFPLSGCLSMFSQHDDNQPRIGSLTQTGLPPVPEVEPVNSRATAIRHYRAFLEESPDNRYVPQALRRLADLELELEQEALIQGSTPPGESTAATLYAELLQRYPDSPDNDSTLYQLAHAYEQSREIEPSMAALTEYTRKHREGDQYDEVQFRRGEYLFVRRDFAQAETAYLAVLEQGRESRFHQQALYKLGWSRFKQNHYRQALDAYTQLLDETISQVDGAELPETLSRIERERVEDALRAVSLSFSYLGSMASIRDYYASQGARAYEPLVYAKLAALYLSQERFSDAAEIYRLFASVHPQHREAPLFQSRVIDVYNMAGFSQRVLQEKQAYIERYEPAAEYWKTHDPSRTPYIMHQVRRHLRDVARHYHAVAQEADKPGAYAEAGRWYQLYLRAYPQAEQAPHMNFLYAELLTRAGQHDIAAHQYERTAYGYGTHDKAAEAGYAALLAYDKHESTLGTPARDRWHRAAIDSALRFADTFPSHKQALSVRVRSAQQLYALDDYPAAVAAAEPVIEDSEAPSRLQLSAWTVIAHAEFDRADYLRAERAYREVLARIPGDDKQREELNEKLAASIYKLGEQEKAAGNLAAAADHFLRIASVMSDSEINTSARYDAAAAFITLQQWPRAIRILEQWQRDNPTHSLHNDATRKLAVLYRENNQPLRAAEAFARLADTETDPDLRREAALTTARLYRQENRHAEAIAAYKRFVHRYPQPVEAAMEARYHLVSLYTQTGRTDKQRYWQQQLVEADRKAGAQRTDRTRYLAAHARLALVAADDHAYRGVQLVEPLQRNLKRKKAHLQSAVDGYKAAAAYKVAAVSTESAYRLGELYSDFGQSLMSSERPADLNAEELLQYDLLLEEQAYPFEEKAIAVHETNAQRISAGLYDTWIRKSMDRLAELLPVRYAKPEKGEDFVAVLQ